MTPEELKQLAEKAAAGTLTQEEELILLKELNNGAEALIELIRTVKEEDK